MAFEFNKQADGVGIPFNYRRGNAIPLDSWSLFMSLDAATTYAKENPVSYPGQVVSVLEGGKSKVYVIVSGSEVGGKENTSTRTLVELGQQSTSGAEMFWLNGDGTQA